MPYFQSSNLVVARSTRGGASFITPMTVLQVTSMLVERLEHIPPDSIFAHRSSGLRGSLIKIIERLEAGEIINPQELEGLYDLAFGILKEVAREKY